MNHRWTFCKIASGNAQEKRAAVHSVAGIVRGGACTGDAITPEQVARAKARLKGRIRPPR